MVLDGFDWDIGNVEECQKHGVSIKPDIMPWERAGRENTFSWCSQKDKEVKK